MEKPEFSLPEAEKRFILEQYRQATTILEYGSGGSTVAAAEMAGKYIMSVENDRDWAAKMVRYFEHANPPSNPIIHYVDLGETGKWARPLNADQYRKFPEYPLNVWDQDFFRQPDVVLIDGRVRTGCLMATMLRTKKPLIAMFDDYSNRPEYHVVEELVEPIEVVGRLAVFKLEPSALDSKYLTLVSKCFVSASVISDNRRQKRFERLYKPIKKLKNYKNFLAKRLSR